MDAGLGAGDDIGRSTARIFEKAEKVCENRAFFPASSRCPV
jgi:hypothetical protein